MLRIESSVYGKNKTIWLSMLSIDLGSKLNNRMVQRMSTFIRQDTAHLGLTCFANRAIFQIRTLGL